MRESSIEFRVRYCESDQMGVVHHANYLAWCEMGRTDLMRQLGVSYAELEHRGVYLPVSEVRVRFRSPARFDERIRVRTSVTRLRSRGVSFAYEVENPETGVALASAETDLVCIDRGGATRTLPDDVRAVLVRALSTPERGNLETRSGVQLE
ncbi:MAG TPA: thioesterase family protein [Gemmatimonadota bacterium]|nr:thioesterase family protein [Gemmatimonadota bacterium]